MSPTSQRSLSDEEHSLFELSSSLKMITNDFTLPDIEEESEGTSRPLSLLSEQETARIHEPDIRYREHSRSAKAFNRRSFDYTRHSFEEAGLDVIETTFDTLNQQSCDPLLSKIVDTLSEMSTSFEEENVLPEAPFLPISPPPGPLLSPRYSMLLAALEESKANARTEADKKRASAMINRLSTISLADDEPPPLPETLPPGKMMSPRNSKLVAAQEQSHLDLSILLSKMTTIYDEKRNTSAASVSETSPQNSPTVAELEDDQILALLPPPDTTEVGFDEVVERRKSILKLTPSFLRNIEPPQEFTVSGLSENNEIADQNQELSYRKDSSTTATTFSEEKQSSSQVCCICLNLMCIATFCSFLDLDWPG